MLKFLYNLKTKTYLFLAVSLSIIPFLNYRVLRMAGDEKVYISQAIEMSRNGSWFVQTLAGEPNYFKGPVHYILIRIGMLIFGNSIISGLWMNALFMILIAYALYALGKKYLDENRAVLLALAGALNVGIFSHALASQMEVEISAFYTFAVVALGLAKQEKGETFFDQLKIDLPFWVIVGVAGWIKSPAHCTLLGAGAILFWIASGQAIQKLRSPGAWAAAIIGALVCIAGYLPIAFLDFDNFYHAYVLRENIEKANNNRAWHYVVSPLLHFLIPWVFVFFFGFFKIINTRIQKNRLALLGYTFAIPTIVFWATFTYKGQNYNLPALPSLLIGAIACLPPFFSRTPFRLMGLVNLVGSLMFIFLVMHFLPLPGWWKPLPLVAAFLFIFSSAMVFLVAQEVRALGVGAVLFFLAFGTIIIPFGEREMRDLRSFVKENPNAILHYDDIDTSIWSEWGLMQFAIHRPIYGIHKPEQLNDALKPGHAILLNSEAGLDRVETAWNTAHQEPDQNSNEPQTYEEDPDSPRIIIWNRWLTKGKGPDGAPMWKTAWNARDLSKLERSFYIYWIPQNSVSTAANSK